MTAGSLIVEVFDAAGMRELSERLSHGNAHRYRLRDPAAAPSGPAALSRHVLRSAGDLLLSAVAERLAADLGQAPRERLRFETAVDWSAPGPGAVRRRLLHAEAEFAREEG